MAETKKMDTRLRMLGMRDDWRYRDAGNEDGYWTAWRDRVRGGFVFLCCLDVDLS